MSSNLTSLSNKEILVSDERPWKVARQGDRDVYQKLYIRAAKPSFLSDKA